MNLKEVLTRARNEVQEENVKKAVELYKRKLREREAALTVLNNVEREIADLELKIERGQV